MFRVFACCMVLLAVGKGFGQNPPPTKQRYVDFAMRTDGDASRGKAIFFSEKTACSKCHAMDEVAARLDLRCLPSVTSFRDAS